MRGNCRAQTQSQSPSTADPSVEAEECLRGKPSPRPWGARKHLGETEGSKPKKLVQVDLGCGGAKPRAALSDPSLPTPPPGVLYPRGWRPGAHRHLRALAELCSHHPARLHSRASRLLGMARRPQPPSPQPRWRRAARACRAHQTCSTFSLPPHAVTLPASKHPGPSGPAQVAITTSRNSPTYTKPERRSGHTAPGRAPRTSANSGG